MTARYALGAGEQTLDLGFVAGRLPPAALSWSTYTRSPYLLSERQAREICDRLRRERVLVSTTHQVHLMDYDPEPNPWGLWCHLHMKRRDRQPMVERWHMNAIKAAVLGEAFEAYELFPAESRLTDSANQYHLYVGPERASVANGWRPTVKESGGRFGRWQVTIEAVDDAHGFIGALMRVAPAEATTGGRLDWRTLQALKNEVVGPEFEGVSVLRGFAGADPGMGISDVWLCRAGVPAPFGWSGRMVLSSSEAAAYGAVQRA